MNIFQEKDARYIWHPCSQMKDYEEFPSIIIERGEGVYLYDIYGKSYIDAVSSWWVNLFGHCNKRINSAISKQLQNLEHVIFANFSHKPAIELAERIVSITPEGLNKVFFADNGSSAVEISLKLSFQFHQQVGNYSKKKFAAICDAYHGETLGALSVGDIDLYNKTYNPLLIDTFKVQGPDCYRCQYGKCRDNCDVQCFEHMEKLVLERHDELCAIIVEPLIQAAAGMKIYPPLYLKKLREICSLYNIHFIADEIAVGFGRTGKMFACEHANISPDIMCLSKGLTAGYLPLSLVVVTDDIYKAFYSDYTELKAFMHSHSYTGNPIACAAACESLNIFRDENILERNSQKSRLIGELTGNLAYNHPFIGEFRQLGMVAGLELVQDKKTKEPFEWTKRIGYQIYKIALTKGILIRPLGNVLYFMPPYIINNNEIEYLVEETFCAINDFFAL